MLPADPAAAVLELFATDLRSVPFPDVDHTSLAAAHDAVQAALNEVAEAEAMLEAAHQALLARQEELAHKATRGLAYAKIYAETDEALAEKVAQIAALPGLSSRSRKSTESAAQMSAPKRRGRPAKTQPGQAALSSLASLEASSHEAEADDETSHASENEAASAAE
jgi:hypothetical protein